MKFIVILFIIFGSTKAQLDEAFVRAFVNKVHKFAVKCIIESRANAGDISELMAYNLPTRHQGKCLIFCLHKGFHLQKEDGSIDQVGALEALKPLLDESREFYEKVLKIFKACNKESLVDKDPCITAINLEQCAKEEGNDVGLNEQFFKDMEKKYNVKLF